MSDENRNNTPEIDPVTGVSTTGHEWDGIKELNTPVPKLARWALIGVFAYSVLVWVLYPAFPRLFANDVTPGLLGYSSRAAVDQDLKKGAAFQSASLGEFADLSPAEMAANVDFRAQFEPSISVTFRDNCAVCHGVDLMGQRNFPNLTDAAWLWSNTPEGIEHTIRVGINSTHPESQFSQMPSFGRDDILSEGEINNVAAYVLSLSGHEIEAETRTAGASLFAENCAACHSDNAMGNPELGAPNLTDNFWIYGGTEHDLYLSIYYGRQGQMPSWQGRLSDQEIKQLTAYVIWAGQDASNGN